MAVVVLAKDIEPHHHTAVVVLAKYIEPYNYTAVPKYIEPHNHMAADAQLIAWEGRREASLIRTEGQ